MQGQSRVPGSHAVVGRAGPGWLVVALHGYGGCGPEITDRLAAAAGDARVVIFAPDGGSAARLVRRGRAWYPVTSRVEEMAARSDRVVAMLAPRVAAMGEHWRIPPARCCVVAFSQGTTIGVGLLSQGLAGRAVLVCGRVPPMRDHAAPWAPPVLVVAGGRDRFAPPRTVRADLEASRLSRSRLVVFPDLDHELRPDVATLAMAFATGRDDCTAPVPAAPVPAHARGSASPSGRQP